MGTMEKGKEGDDGNDGDDGKDGKSKKKDDDDCSICNLRKDLKKYFDDNFDKEEPKLPKLVDKDYTRRRTIDLGSASCPAPHQINLSLVGTITFDYQPICNVASIARFFVLISSAVMSVYILLGVQRRG